MAYNSVNTAPIDTIKSFYSNGVKDRALPISDEVIKNHFRLIQSAGIDFNQVIEKQISDGLEAFKEAFKEILDSL